MDNILKISTEINSYLSKLPKAISVPHALVPKHSLVPETVVETEKRTALESTVPFLQSILDEIKRRQCPVDFEAVKRRGRFIEARGVTCSGDGLWLVDEISLLEQSGVREIKVVRMDEKSQGYLFSRLREYGNVKGPYDDYMYSKVKVCPVRQSDGLQKIYEYLAYKNSRSGKNK